MKETEEEQPDEQEENQKMVSGVREKLSQEEEVVRSVK